MKRKLTIHLIYTILWISTQRGSALECYSCDTRYGDPGCASFMTLRNEWVRECLEGQTFCGTVFTKGQITRTMRGCAADHYQPSTSCQPIIGYEGGEICSEYCSTDLCNGHGFKGIFFWYEIMRSIGHLIYMGMQK